MSEEYAEKTTTKFNAGIAKLERMNKLRIGCHEARMRKQYTLWLDCLTGWRSEMNDKLEKEQQGVCNSYENLIQLSITPVQAPNQHPFSQFGKVKPNYYTVTFLLNQYELYLGELENKYGYGMPLKDGVGDLIAEME